MTIDRAGYPFIGGTAALALAAALTVGSAGAVPLILLAAFFVFFFRDPERMSPQDPALVPGLLGPNPALAGSVVALRSAGPGPIEVFGVDGRRILRLPDGGAESEEAVRFTAPSAPGIYVVRAASWSKKLAVIGRSDR